MDAAHKIFLAAPTARPQPIRAELCGSAPGSFVNVASMAYCPLEYGFNQHWVAALNSRQHFGWTDFAMVHEDVTPLGLHWLARLASERRRVGADILSVVLRLRDESGVTSTALGESSDCDRVTRLTMRQTARLPQTFSIDDCRAAGFAGDTLLVNTGLWICDFAQPWVEQIHFESRTSIRWSDARRRWEACLWPEDWNFSRRARELGLKVFATTGLVADHAGFRNDAIVGQEIDLEALELNGATR